MAVSCEVAGAVVSLSASSLTGIWDPRVASAIGPVLSLLATRQCVCVGGGGGVDWAFASHSYILSHFHFSYL